MRERGLKYGYSVYAPEYTSVAPVRERGLKFLTIVGYIAARFGRSREGAWIEICNGASSKWLRVCRSREGAWIEMCGYSIIDITI